MEVDIVEVLQHVVKTYPGSVASALGTSAAAAFAVYKLDAASKANQVKDAEAARVLVKELLEEAKGRIEELKGDVKSAGEEGRQKGREEARHEALDAKSELATARYTIQSQDIRLRELERDVAKAQADLKILAASKADDPLAKANLAQVADLQERISKFDQLATTYAKAKSRSLSSPT
jgi:hypothetical protein